MTERNWKDQIQKETENMTAANSVTTRAKGRKIYGKCLRKRAMATNRNLHKAECPLMTMAW